LWTRIIADSHRPALDADPGGAGDPARRQTADLGPGAEPDPAVDALGAQLLLLLAERGDIDELHESVERPVVIAGVVDHPGCRLGREVLLGDEVLPADLDRIHPQLMGKLVERDLDHLSGLGPSGTADRVRGALVGEHSGDVGSPSGSRST
jgi:hypothetical protein